MYKFLILVFPFVPLYGMHNVKSLDEAESKNVGATPSTLVRNRQYRLVLSSSEESLIFPEQLLRHVGIFQSLLEAGAAR